jgi:hypothetical protein
LEFWNIYDINFITMLMFFGILFFQAFKLNPGAKNFSPSFSNPTSANAPALPTVASMAYIPCNSPVVPVAAVQPEVGIPCAPRSSVPAKFPPYSNLTAVNGGSGSQFSPVCIS